MVSPTSSVRFLRTLCARLDNRTSRLRFARSGHSNLPYTKTVHLDTITIEQNACDSKNEHCETPNAIVHYSEMLPAALIAEAEIVLLSSTLSFQRIVNAWSNDLAKQAQNLQISGTALWAMLLTVDYKPQDRETVVETEQSE